MEQARSHMWGQWDMPAALRGTQNKPNWAPTPSYSDRDVSHPLCLGFEAQSTRNPPPRVGRPRPRDLTEGTLGRRDDDRGGVGHVSPRGSMSGARGWGERRKLQNNDMG